MIFKKTTVLFLFAPFIFISCKDDDVKKNGPDKPIFKIVEDKYTSLKGINYSVDFNYGNEDLFSMPPKNYSNDIFEKENSSALFNSSKNEYSKLKNELVLSDNFSISIWIKPSENKGDLIPIISRSIDSQFKKPYYQFLLALRGGSYKDSPYSFFCWLSLGNELVSLSSLMNWQPNNWYNLIITYNQKSIKFYINGKLQGQKGATGLINFSSEEVYVAKHCKFDYYYNGSIDNLQVFDRELTLDEVLILFD